MWRKEHQYGHSSRASHDTHGKNRMVYFASNLHWIKNLQISRFFFQGMWTSKPLRIFHNLGFSFNHVP